MCLWQDKSNCTWTEDEDKDEFEQKVFHFRKLVLWSPHGPSLTLQWRRKEKVETFHNFDYKLIKNEEDFLERQEDLFPTLQ